MEGSYLAASYVPSQCSSRLHLRDLISGTLLLVHLPLGPIIRRSQANEYSELSLATSHFQTFVQVIVI